MTSCTHLKFPHAATAHCTVRARLQLALLLFQFILLFLSINNRPNNPSNPLLHHHHQRRTKHPPRKLRSNPLIQPQNPPRAQLLLNHLRNRRLHLGISIGTLQHDLGPQVWIREHGGNNTGNHAEEECLGGRECVADNGVGVSSMSMRMGLDTTGGNDDFFDLFVDRVLNGWFEAEDGVGLDSFVEATNSLGMLLLLIIINNNNVRV